MHLFQAESYETDTNRLYFPNSILGDDILIQIFLSVLRQCSKINFKLDLQSSSFLDISWHIPQVVKLELVPSQSIGMSVSFANGKAVIVGIKQNSMLSEIGDVKIGDILDELNGIHICTATRGRLSSILKLNKNGPITLSVIKAVYGDSKQIFPPIVSLLKQVQIDPDLVKNNSIDGCVMAVSQKKIKSR